MRVLAQTILLLSTGYLPVAYAFLKLQALTGNDVEHGCSQEQLSHLIESVRQASEAAHNTGSTLLSARDHSFPAIEILLGGQHYEDPSMKETLTGAVTKHLVNVAVVLGKTFGTASEYSHHPDTLNFACPLEQERPVVVGSGPSGIRNVLKIGPSFFTLSSEPTVDQEAYDAAKTISRNSRIFAQMPAFTSAPFHILRAMAQTMLGMPVRASPLSLGRIAGGGLEADGCASVCILYQLDKETFSPCNAVGVAITRPGLPTCPSIAMGMLGLRTSRVRRTTPGPPTIEPPSPDPDKPLDVGLGGLSRHAHMRSKVRPPKRSASASPARSQGRPGTVQRSATALLAAPVAGDIRPSRPPSRLDHVDKPPPEIPAKGSRRKLPAPTPPHAPPLPGSNPLPGERLRPWLGRTS